MTEQIVRPEPRVTSFSEIDAWSTCRRKWHWLYQRNIEPRVSKRTPVVGSCGHEALRAFYHGQNWSQAIDTWLENETTTRMLFDEDLIEYQMIADTVKAIMPRYISHYPGDRLLKTVVAEHQFEIPIPQSAIRLQGYFDAIVQDERGDMWLMETKFPSNQFRSEEDIDLDAQLGIYHYAAHKIGFPVVGIIYNQILGQKPSAPKLNKDGSMSRAAVRCDWPTYEAYLMGNGLDPADYQDMREKLSGVEFFRRYYRYRPMVEVKNFVRDLQQRIWDMSRKRPRIYMSENRFHCGMCPFRDLCIEGLKGNDIDHLIQLQYQQRRSRRNGVNNESADALPLEEDEFELRIRKEIHPMVI